MPIFILIRATVWPQFTNVTDRTGQRGQTGQRSDSIGLTVLQTVAQKRTRGRGSGRWFVKSLARYQLLLLIGQLQLLKQWLICLRLRSQKYILQYFMLRVFISFSQDMQEPKKSEIYSVRNLDLKFDAKKYRSARSHESILVFAKHTVTRYILRHFNKFTVNRQVWFLTVLSPNVSNKHGQSIIAFGPL